jgi:hypothetical protein
MPELANVGGVSVRLYYREEHQLPHVACIYGDYAINMDQNGQVLAGELPPRQLRVVREWVGEHQSEILAQWKRARDHLPIERIGHRPVRQLAFFFPLEGHMAVVRFVDGTQWIVDLHSLVCGPGVLAPLCDPQVFQKGTVEMGALAWGDVDFSGESIWALAQAEGQQL